MSFASAAVRAAVGAVVLAGVLIACSSDPTPAAPKTYCDDAKAAAVRCKEPQPCDSTLTDKCVALDKAVSPTAVTAVKDCLQSGICGASNCLTRAQKSAKPTDAHLQLATRYCAQCAVDVPDCVAQFYNLKSTLPGVLVLPYVDAVATAVADSCTAEAGACRATFTTCANDTIARTLGGLAPDVAECVNAAFHRDDGAVQPGGGVQVQTCTADNCKGCCREDKCIEGTQPDACGLSASACQICSPVQQCTAEGQCREPCGPNNCQGCCDSGACIPGTTTDKCGGEGQACTKCNDKNPDLVCQEKKCVDGSCKANCPNGCCSATGCQTGTLAEACGTGAATCKGCGYGRTCSTAKACALDQESLWDVAFTKLVVPRTSLDGNSWDSFSGAPDVYVKAYSSFGTISHTGQTTTQNDTFELALSESPLKAVSAKELLANISFEVWDSDNGFGVDPDDLMGGCRVAMTEAVFDGSLRVVTCSATASTPSVTLYFKVVPKAN